MKKNNQSDKVAYEEPKLVDLQIGQKDAQGTALCGSGSGQANICQDGGSAASTCNVGSSI